MPESFWSHEGRPDETEPVPTVNVHTRERGLRLSFATERQARRYLRLLQSGHPGLARHRDHYASRWGGMVVVVAPPSDPGEFLRVARPRQDAAQPLPPAFDDVTSLGGTLEEQLQVLRGIAEILEIARRLEGDPHLHPTCGPADLRSSPEGTWLIRVTEAEPAADAQAETIGALARIGRALGTPALQASEILRSASRNAQQWATWQDFLLALQREAQAIPSAPASVGRDEDFLHAGSTVPFVRKNQPGWRRLGGARPRRAALLYASVLVLFAFFSIGLILKISQLTP